MIRYNKSHPARADWLESGFTKTCVADTHTALERAETALLAYGLDSTDPRVAKAALEVAHLNQMMVFLTKESK